MSVSVSLPTGVHCNMLLRNDPMRKTKQSCKSYIKKKKDYGFIKIILLSQKFIFPLLAACKMLLFRYHKICIKRVPVSLHQV